jgi:hypothetical protein
VKKIVLKLSETYSGRAGIRIADVKYMFVSVLLLSISFEDLPF